MDATDGRTLSWEALGSGGAAEHAGVVQPDAVREAMWAETRKMPTICRRHSKKRAVDRSKYLTWFAPGETTGTPRDDTAVAAVGRAVHSPSNSKARARLAARRSASVSCGMVG